MTVLHTFCALNNCADGIYPSLGLTFARNGNLYGVSNSPDGSSIYQAVVFETSTSGSLHPLITVCPGYVCPADAGPIGSLLLSTGGSLHLSRTNLQLQLRPLQHDSLGSSYSSLYVLR